MQRSRRRRLAVQAILSGLSYPAAAARYDVPMSSLWRWVHTDVPDPPNRDQRIPKRVQRKIAMKIDAGVGSLRAIARQCGVHHKTVSMIRDRITYGGHAPRPHRCPECGTLIVTRVCLACQATGKTTLGKGRHNLGSPDDLAL